MDAHLICWLKLSILSLARALSNLFLTSVLLIEACTGKAYRNAMYQYRGQRLVESFAAFKISQPLRGFLSFLSPFLWGRSLRIVACIALSASAWCKDLIDLIWCFVHWPCLDFYPVSKQITSRLSCATRQACLAYFLYRPVPLAPRVRKAELIHSVSSCYLCAKVSVKTTP